MRECRKFRATVPLRNVGQVVGPDDKEEVGIHTVRVSEIVQCVVCIGWLRPLYVDHADRESRLFFDRCSNHGAAVARIGDERGIPVRRLADGDEKHHVKVEDAGSLACHQQVHVMDRVKGAAQNSDPRSIHRPAPHTRHVTTMTLPFQVWSDQRSGSNAVHVIDLVENRPGNRRRHEGRPDGIASEIGNLGRPKVKSLGDLQKYIAEPGTEHRRVVGVQREEQARRQKPRQGMRPKRRHNSGPHVRRGADLERD